MTDLRELYQEIILDHNHDPRNFRVMEEPTHQAQGFNRLCGDKVTVYLKLKEGIVEEVSFVGRGCAISQASSSLMTEAIQGKTIQEVEGLFAAFHDMMTAPEKTSHSLPVKLTVLEGVRDYPARVKCATLAWHTLEAALKQSHETVTTE